MLKHQLKLAFRNLWKQKSASFINVTGLSLGMAAAVLIMLWVQNELNFDNFHPHAGDIYYVQEGLRTGQQKFAETPLALSESIQQEVPGVVETTRFMPGSQSGIPIF